jgi:biotin carboxyl carrier protein
MTYNITINGSAYRLELKGEGNRWHCRLDGRDISVDALLARPDVLSVLIQGKAYEIQRERIGTELYLWVGNRRYAAEVSDPRSWRSRKDGGGGDKGPKKLIAPMPGKVVRVLVQEKARVEAGQGVLVVEAMKMQNEIKSPKAGTVQRLAVAAGAAVNAGDVLAIVE